MGKNKLKRFAENLQFSNMFQPDVETCREGYEKKGRWHTVFGNTNPIVLELGCGKGEYTVGLARKYPNKNFIGVDIKGARMWRGCKTSVEENISNIAFLRTRIQFIESCFDKGEISEIWITFPDPQAQKENNRLSSPVFLERYRNILQPGGRIHLKTDDTDLYTYTLKDVVEAKEHCLFQAISDLYHPEQAHLEVMDIQTFYEQKWLKEGKSIKYLSFALKPLE